MPVIDPVEDRGGKKFVGRNFLIGNFAAICRMVAECGAVYVFGRYADRDHIALVSLERLEVLEELERQILVDQSSLKEAKHNVGPRGDEDLFPLGIPAEDGANS